MMAETTVHGHLYSRGLLEGRHSDITVKAFGKSYRLHRIILDRAPFFSSALTEPWLEASQEEIELHPNDIDSNITQSSFELALKRLYGCHSRQEEDAEASELFATGCWLEMQDLVDASVDSILRRMHIGNLAPTLQLVTSNYYGKAGDRILGSAKAMLSRDGWLMPLRAWDEVPSELIRELVGADGFFVHGEWERFVLTRQLLNRRIKSAAKRYGLWRSIQVPACYRSQACRPTTPTMSNGISQPESPSGSGSETLDRLHAIYSDQEVMPLLRLLDRGVHYIHMTFEQLQVIRLARDVLGCPLVPQKLVADALWSSLELRQKVVSARDKELSLGLSRAAELPECTDELRPTSQPTGTQKSGRREVGHQTTGESPAILPRYWIPSADCNITVGAGADSAFNTSTYSQGRATRIATAFPTDPASPRYQDTTTDASTPMSPGDAQPTCYSNFPPFRFAAEFPNPRALKERKRVYSRTVFYAGSFWNVYIQKVKSGSKTPQLGVYLHRARERDPEDRAGRAAVDERIDALEHEMSMRKEQRLFRLSPGPARRVSSTALGTPPNDMGSGNPDSNVTQRLRHTSYLINRQGNEEPSAKQTRNRSISMEVPLISTEVIAGPSHLSSASISPAEIHSTPSSSGSDDDDDQTDNTTPRLPHALNTTATSTLPPYIDARPTIKTYFKIYSPSRGGRVLSVYESAPDNFNFSQSWGWKSSSLMLEESEEEEEDWEGSASRGLNGNAATIAGGGAGEHAGTGLRVEEASEDEMMGGGGGGGSGGLTTGLSDEGTGSGFAAVDEGERVGSRRRARRNLRFMVVLGVV